VDQQRVFLFRQSRRLGSACRLTGETIGTADRPAAAQPSVVPPEGKK
jgi:hypothetical protein